MFIPKRIIFESNSLNYEIGNNIYEYFKNNNKVEIIEAKNNRFKNYIPNQGRAEFYKEGKNTLIVGVKKVGKFQSCKPSAHYQLPLLSGCTGQCQYCYLNTNMGDRPFIKINANYDDIMDRAQRYMDERAPSVTIFEGSATSDPLPVEPYAHLLEKTINYFAHNDLGRFRFVSKYSDVDTFLNLDHNNKTEIRFTINTDKVIGDYENRTASKALRLEAAKKVAEAGYPLGFIIAPVFLYDGWKEDYRELLINLKDVLPPNLPHELTFEVISHRFTPRAKNIITEVFPDNTLPMNEEERQYKYGQFGYGKYVYPKESLNEMKEFFTKEIGEIFEDGIIKYII